MTQQIQVRGLRELNSALKEFPDKLKKKAVRRAIAAGTKLVQKQAKINAPKKSGVLRRAIAVRSTPSRSQPNLVRSSVFVRTGGKRTKAARARGDDPFYWYFQEFGWRATGRRKRGGGLTRSKFRSNGRHIPPKRFMRNAFNSTHGRVLVTFRRTLTREINTYNASRN